MRPSCFLPVGRVWRWRRRRVVVVLAGGGRGGAARAVVVRLVERAAAAVLFPEVAGRVQLRVHVLEAIAQFRVAQAKGPDLVLAADANAVKLLAESLNALPNMGIFTRLF